MKIKTLIVTSAQLLKSSSSNTHENMLILTNLQVPICLRDAPKIHMVLWKSPNVLWMKVNTDGSFLENSSACGGIFRDHNGNHFGSFASKLPHFSVLHTEFMALILAFELAASHGWDTIWLESDPKAALDYNDITSFLRVNPDEGLFYYDCSCTYIPLSQECNEDRCLTRCLGQPCILSDVSNN
ncbi:ribonuclease H [Trifolium pratense]|uniref:Ribonuclease H n=1 Tax=Trifolium pratense TaxID=57577 RepID=A0A2K3MMN4_TRIPR|nr:ribonuclease H [Trifolium pratense]